MVAEVPSPEVVHHQVEVEFVLEGALHVDKEGVVEDAKYFPLVED